MSKNPVAALILILIGAILLANNLGWTSVSIGRLISVWWPALLIAVGVALLVGRGK
jgi:lia operon protein LiaF